MPRDGWVATELMVMGPDPTLWTVAEAAVVLGLSKVVEKKLRDRLPYTHVFPVGKRRSAVTVYPVVVTTRKSGAGRYAKVYHAAELIELVEILRLDAASEGSDTSKVIPGVVTARVTT